VGSERTDRIRDLRRVRAVEPAFESGVRGKEYKEPLWQPPGT
jgi:hypothetical protein